MAYRFIQTNCKIFGLRWLLRRMKIHPNAYYNHLRQNKESYYKQKDKACNEIKSIYHEFGGVLGHRSMKVFLDRSGICLSKTTVHRYMNKELRLYSVCRRKKPGYRKGQPHKIFPNLLNQDFTVPEPNRVWCTDFTYVHLSTGMIRFNCAILDLFDRSVVASETGMHITSSLAIKTLSKAISSQRGIPDGLILHSDQGSQYTSLEFIMFCNEHGIIQSMSKAGCPYDNAPMERYYNTLKAELINRYYFSTDEELRTAIAEFAYSWYNQIRPHSYNNYLTPFEMRFKNRQN